MMKLKLDLVSMLLVSVNGRSSVPDIKKIKAKEGFTDVRPTENTPMLKSIMSSQNKLFTILSIDFSCPLPEFYFPFYNLL